jgi:hypothetical protein
MYKAFGRKGEGRRGPLIKTVDQNAIREERAIHVATHTAGHETKR